MDSTKLDDRVLTTPLDPNTSLPEEVLHMHPEISENIELRAQDIYSSVIEYGERYGLPVRFLLSVEHDYVIGAAWKDSYTNPIDKQLFINDSFLKAVERHISNPKKWVSSNLSTAIGNIYHESVHAYFNLKLAIKEVAELIRKGTSYYTNAPLRNGQMVDDPSRVFQEAVASYVGNRVSTWCLAFSSLSDIISGGYPPENIPSRIDFIREQYNGGMVNRVFGYQNPGFIGKLTGKQIYTTLPISSEIMSFLDHTILEDKLPENFDEVIPFLDLVNQARNLSKREEK